MNLLHIDSSPRREQSNSRLLSKYLSKSLSAEKRVYRDLAADPLPPISSRDLVDLHGGNVNERPEFLRQLSISDQLIAELKWADTLVIGTPIHNFSVPSVLKQWIDRVCRAGETFKYTSEGPVGLTGIDTAYIIVASGGTPIGGNIDFLSGYLRHLCRFIGVSDIHVIDAGGSKRKTDEIIANGKAQIASLLAETA